MRVAIIVTAIGILVGAALLFFWAITNEPSREVKFQVRHLLSHRPVNERSRLQLVLEGGLAVVLAGLLLWLLAK
jgi:hypothetical protein